MLADCYRVDSIVLEQASSFLFLGSKNTGSNDLAVDTSLWFERIMCGRNVTIVEKSCFEDEWFGWVMWKTH